MLWSLLPVKFTYTRSHTHTNLSNMAAQTGSNYAKGVAGTWHVFFNRR